MGLVTPGAYSKIVEGELTCVTYNHLLTYNMFSLLRLMNTKTK
jgi:hypothetical protein